MQKIYEKLAAIQAEIHSPKSEYNAFGKYAYRTAEAILEAVKPFLKAQGCVLNCSDDLVLIGDRYYIKTTATITCVEDGSEISTTAWAREELDKKGMDQSQVTGASSSYARKYALNGLLCIDNTPDSDATNTTERKDEKPAAQRKRQAPAPAAKLLPSQDPALWQKWVVAIAEGRPTKSGKDSRQAYIENYHPTQDEINALEDDVFKYQLQHGIDPEHPAPAAANA